MIYVLTVHWQTPFWIPIQHKYLNRFVRRPFKTFAFLTGMDRNYSKYFHYSCFEDITNKTTPGTAHAAKLNILADMVLMFAPDEDVLIFLDGDAFPINDIDDGFILKMKEHKLAAIQRVENNGDIQPHPSFCATTVGFWKEIKGTWHRGYYWKDNQGNMITDVGGNLLKILQDHHIDWHRMLRTNKKNLHPLAFGIYENLIYHHALGFRKGTGGRVAVAQWGGKEVLERLDVRILNRVIPKRYQKMINPYYRGLDNLRKEFVKLNTEVANMILDNEDFYEEFI
jgi:hypothetical protein